MGRKLALLPALVALLTTPVGAYALGLGNIKLRSALDQPMEAEIDLQISNSAELEGLRVMLASDQLFRNAAIERAPFLSNLRFVITKKSDGTPYIKVSSAQPVREPFLNFLVEASWPNGRAVRQYTVLVDPPTTTQESAPAITAPKAVAPAARPVAAPTASVAKPVDSVPASQPKAGERASRMTQRNDTLWIIANEMRAGTQLTTQQMMVALQRENPEAFYQGNMNRLKAGYVLRLKDQRAAMSMAQTAAVAEVNRQYDEWKGIKRVASTVQEKDKKPAVVSAEKADAATVPAKARLKLVGTSAQTAPAGVDAGKDAKADGMDKLQQDVAIANENMIARQQETEELRGRIAALEAQIANMQKTVTLKDKQLAELQLHGAVATEQAEVSGDLLQNPMVQGVAGLLVVLLGAGGWYLSQRRRKPADESILAPMSAGSAQPAATPPPAAVPAGGDSKPITASDSSFLTDFSVSSIEGIQTEVGEIDPMSEADVYLAYGRYNQAEEIMAQAIANDPSRMDYRLKLCEIHYAAKDSARFLRAAEAMHTAGATGPMWQRVAVMGRDLCPDAPLFSGEGGSVAAIGAVAAAAAAAMVASPASADAFGQAASPESRDDTSLDLGSALDFGFTPGTAAGATDAKSEVSDSNLMEFDVSSWMSSSPEKEAAEAEARRKLDEELATNSLSFDASDFAAAEPSAAEAAPASNEFNLDSVEPLAEQSYDLVHASVDAAEAEKASSDDDFFKDMDLSFGAAKPSTDEGVTDLDFSDLTAPLPEHGQPNAAAIDLSDFAVESADAGKSSLQGLDDFDLSSFAPMTPDDGVGEFAEDALFADIDEIGTKLDLARAYIDMEDKDGARSLLDEILLEGNDTQRAEAQALIDKLG